MNDDDIVRYIPLVKAIAYRIHQKVRRFHELEDLVSCGYIGLMAAAKNYNPELGEMDAYVAIKIRGAIKDHLRIEFRGTRRHYERGGQDIVVLSADGNMDDEGGLMDQERLAFASQAFRFFVRNQGKFTYGEQFVFWARYYFGFTEKFAASLVDLHTSQLNSDHRQMLIKLRKMLK